MQKISKDQLVKLFLNPAVSGINGNTFVGLDTISIVKLTGGKKNPMQSSIEKCVAGSQVQVFQNKTKSAYGAMVQRRLNKEDKEIKFELKPRTWGVRVEGTPIIEHKGEFYLEVIFIKSGNVSYLYNSKPIKKDLIEGLPVKKEGTQGGLEDKVIIRTYKIASLSRVTINKETYLIVD